MYLVALHGNQVGLKIKSMRVYSDLRDVYKYIIDQCSLYTASPFYSFHWGWRVYEVQSDGSLVSIKREIQNVIGFFKPHY